MRIPTPSHACAFHSHTPLSRHAHATHTPLSPRGGADAMDRGFVARHGGKGPREFLEAALEGKDRGLDRTKASCVGGK